MFKTTIILFCFFVVLLCVFTFWVPCCDVRYEFNIKQRSVRLYLQLFVTGRDHVLFMFFVVVSMVSNTLFCACVSVLFVFVFSTRYCCQFFVVHFLLPLRYSSFIHSLLLETKWYRRAWHSSDTWHPCSSLPSEGEFYLILYFVFSDRGKNIFILSRTIKRACCESFTSKWFRVCLSFFDLRILITPLVSSHSSSENNNYKHLKSYIEFVMQCWSCRISNPTVQWLFIHSLDSFKSIYSH